MMNDLMITYLPLYTPLFEGTGKTHSIVNTAATALCRNLNVLVTSSNSRALHAFVEKLPEGIRDLCVDFSSCVGGDTTSVRRSLEKIQLLLRELRVNLDMKEKEIEVSLGFIDSRLRQGNPHLNKGSPLVGL
jgi:hypothetical protein